MRTVLFALILIAWVAHDSVGQNKVDNDPTYSAYNYKHLNKAAYAKKHNLDKAATLGVIEVVQNDNYKQANRRTKSNKLGAVVREDKNRVYPNYKHQVGNKK